MSDPTTPPAPLTSTVPMARPLADVHAAGKANTGVALRATLRAAATVANPCWADVVTRNAARDGDFYYAVKTTGVYCRPSCGARTPRPENVVFHVTTAAAEAAGFRPCKRCRPTEAPLQERQAALVAQLCRHIDTAEQAPSLDQLAQLSSLSVYHLHRVFKAVTGLTPKAYANARRGHRVRAELARTSSVTAALYGAGYQSQGCFYAGAGNVLGMTPGAYRDGGAHTRIRFAVGQCSLGAILVAASTRGVCAILIGDDPALLLQDLQDRFPRAELEGGDAEFEAMVATVVGFVEAPQLGLALPLDVRGTAFQHRVWQALREIPAGQTASYTQIAQRIGAPAAVRAVAGACAANPVAVAIPCHRVVRNDGALSGYRWGIERKRILLDHEKSATAVVATVIKVGVI